MIQRLPPKAAPFQAHDSEDMRNALSHFQCPHKFFFELFRAVQREAFVLDHDVIELSGYESSVSADADSDAEESELGPAPDLAPDLAPDPVPELGPDPEVEPAPDPESRQSLTFVKEPDGPDAITVDDLNHTVIDLTQTVVEDILEAVVREVVESVTEDTKKIYSNVVTSMDDLDDLNDLDVLGGLNVPETPDALDIPDAPDSPDALDALDALGAPLSDSTDARVWLAERHARLDMEADEWLEDV